MGKSISQALAFGQWKVAIEIATNEPKKAHVWASQPGPMYSGSPYRIDKNLQGQPIHEAANLGAPVEVVEALCRAAPEKLERRDMVLKRLPLHTATQRQPPDEKVVRCLVTHYKGAVAETDKQGSTPFHYAFMNGASEETIRIMLDAYSNVCKAQDKGGQTPLHLACAKGYSTELIHDLLKLNPNGAILKSNNGMTASKLATQCGAPNQREVLELLESFSAKANQQFRTARRPTSARMVV